MDKFDFFKTASDMICLYGDRFTNTERRLKESLNKVGDLLKVEKWTTIANKVTIKGLEENTASLISNPDDGFQIKSLIQTKNIEIPNLNKQIKNSNVDPLHRVEINKVEQEK